MWITQERADMFILLFVLYPSGKQTQEEQQQVSLQDEKHFFHFEKNKDNLLSQITDISLLNRYYWYDK